MKEGYKKTELGWIPEEWEVKKIEDVIDLLKSGLSRKLEDTNVGIPCIRSNNIKNNRLVLNDLKYWYRVDNKGAKIEDYILNEGDIVVNFINSTSQIGKGCIFNRSNFETIYTTNLLRIKVNKNNMNNKFFYYYTQTERYKKEVNLITKPAVNQASFTTVEYKAIKLPVPPLKEQEKIAEILSIVDSQIDDTERIIEKTKELKKGLMQQLLTKGIGHSEFKKTEVGEIPVGWEVVNFFEFVNKVIDFRGRTPKKLGLEWGNGNILALSANNVKMGKIDFEEENYLGSEILYNKWMKGNELEQGDILLTMEAPLGNIALVPDSKKYILSQRVIALKTNKNIYNKFMLYMLMSNKIQTQLGSFSTGTTAKGINQKNLSKVKVLIPNYKEQEKIANILSSVDEEIDQYEKKKLRLEELKKGLMQKLLTGEIRVKC